MLYLQQTRQEDVFDLIASPFIVKQKTKSQEGKQAGSLSPPGFFWFCCPGDSAGFLHHVLLLLVAIVLFVARAPGETVCHPDAGFEGNSADRREQPSCSARAFSGFRRSVWLRLKVGQRVVQYCKNCLLVTCIRCQCLFPQALHAT